jgi:hypothetical protein
VVRRTGKVIAATIARRPVRGSPLASAALLLSAVSISSEALAQRPPSGDELRSMYCVEVLRAEIGLQHHLISSADAAASSAPTPALRQQWIDTSAELLQGLERLEVVRYRLQAYMLPRIPALDSQSLAVALRQGDNDFQESRSLAEQVMLNRVSACEKPTWLPP